MVALLRRSSCLQTVGEESGINLERGSRNQSAASFGVWLGAFEASSRRSRGMRKTRVERENDLLSSLYTLSRPAITRPLGQKNGAESSG